MIRFAFRAVSSGLCGQPPQKDYPEDPVHLKGYADRFS